MRRGRVLFFLAFVLILGLVAVLVVYMQFFRQPSQQAQVTKVATTINVVAVTQRVPRGDLLTEDMIGLIPWERSAVISDTMFVEANMVEVYGRQARYDLEPGVPLFEDMLVDPGEQLSEAGSPAALNIPRGMVAISVPISRLTSVSYGLRPGDHVDVIVSMLFVDLDQEFQTITPNYTGVVLASGPADPETGEREPLTVDIGTLMPTFPFDPNSEKAGSIRIASPGIQGRAEIDPVLGMAVYLVPSENQRPRMASQMLLQDIVVLQMGTFTLPGQQEQQAQAEQQPAEGEQEGQQKAVAQPDVITLVVTPQDAVTLNYLVLTGAHLNLAMRAANDDTRANITPVTLQFLLEQYQIPIPFKLPYGVQPRVDELVPPVLENDQTK